MAATSILPSGSGTAIAPAGCQERLHRHVHTPSSENESGQAQLPVTRAQYRMIAAPAGYRWAATIAGARSGAGALGSRIGKPPGRVRSTYVPATELALVLVKGFGLAGGGSLPMMTFGCVPRFSVSGLTRAARHDSGKHWSKCTIKIVQSCFVGSEAMEYIS